MIRAGFGIFYAYQTYNSNPQAKNAPFNGSLVVSNATGEAGYAAALPISAGFPAARPDLFPPPARLSMSSSGRIRTRPPTSGISTCSDRFRAHDTLSVAYVAQNGVHILINPNINQADARSGSGRKPPRLSQPGGWNVELHLRQFLVQFASGDLPQSSLCRISISRAPIPSPTASTIPAATPTGGNPEPGEFASVSGEFGFRHPPQPGVELVVRTALRPRQEVCRRRARPARRRSSADGGSTASIPFVSGAPFTPVMVSSLLNSGSAGQWPNRIGSGDGGESHDSSAGSIRPTSFLPETTFSGTRAETFCSDRARNSSTCPCSRILFQREAAPASSVPRRSVQRVQHAAIQQSQRADRQSRGRHDHLRGRSAAFPADVASDPARSEVVLVGELRTVIPILLFAFQLGAIVYARFVPTRYFCWAPYDIANGLYSPLPR